MSRNIFLFQEKLWFWGMAWTRPNSASSGAAPPIAGYWHFSTPLLRINGRWQQLRLVPVSSSLYRRARFFIRMSCYRLVSFVFTFLKTVMFSSRTWSLIHIPLLWCEYHVHFDNHACKDSLARSASHYTFPQPFFFSIRTPVLLWRPETHNKSITKFPCPAARGELGLLLS